MVSYNIVLGVMRQPTASDNVNMKSHFFMTDILLNNINISQQLSTSEYLKHFEKEIGKSITLESLTKHFITGNNYYTEKPYLYRRKIKSVDNRFESFEIVYDESEKIHAIVFDLKIKLSRLQEIFGQPFMQNEPYSETTAFAFKSVNRDIEIINTRHPNWLTKTKNNGYEYSEKDDDTYTLVDPEFNFIQFTLTKIDN